MASRAVAGRMSWRRASTVRGLVVEGASRTGSRSSGLPCCSMSAACESPVPLALLPRYDRSMSNIAPAEWEDESRSCTCNCDCVDRVRRACPSGGSARRPGGPHNPGLPCHLLRDCYASRRGHSAAYSTVSGSDGLVGNPWGPGPAQVLSDSALDPRQAVCSAAP